MHGTGKRTNLGRSARQSLNLNHASPNPDAVRDPHTCPVHIGSADQRPPIQRLSRELLCIATSLIYINLGVITVR